MDQWAAANRGIKTDRTLNFSALPQEDDLSYSRRKITRDPMSHRIIEKRRRDRMNNCLADLSRLIPHQYMKKSRGRIEKTEIIEMAIKHLKHLQAHSCKDLASCDIAKTTDREWQHQYHLGFQECMSEAVRFLVESEGLFPTEGVCFRLLTHLQEHYDKLAWGCYPNGRANSHQNNNTTQIDMDSTSIQTSNTLDGFPTSAKRPRSPSYEHQQNLHQANEQQADNCCENITPASASQLREMLQNPNVPIERMRSNSTSSTASSYSSRPYLSSYDNYSKGQSCEEVYKFKTNIKERFNADLHHQVDDTPVKFSVANVHKNNSCGQFSSPSSSKCRPSRLTITTSENHQHNSNNNELSVKTITEEDLDNGQNDPQTDSSNGSSSPTSNGHSNGSSSPPSNRHSNGSSSGYSTSGDTLTVIKQQQSRSQSPESNIYSRRDSYTMNNGRPASPYSKPTLVPVFALHPKGNFYVPFSLDAGLLEPHFHAVDYGAPVLHPVSISVNFSCPVNVSSLEQASWLPRNDVQAPIHQNSVYDRYRDRSY